MNSLRLARRWFMSVLGEPGSKTRGVVFAEFPHIWTRTQRTPERTRWSPALRFDVAMPVEEVEPASAVVFGQPMPVGPSLSAVETNPELSAPAGAGTSSRAARPPRSRCAPAAPAQRPASEDRASPSSRNRVHSSCGRAPIDS